MNRASFYTLTLVLLAILQSGCSSFLYYPDNYMYVEEETMEYKPQDLVFKINDKQEVHSWYFSTPKKPKAIVVFFHGNAQNRTSHIVGLYWMIKAGYDVFAVEYPGYADSEGKPNPKNTVETAVAAIRFAHAKKPKIPLIVYGQSLGGAIALRAVIDLKDEIKPALVVADSTFLSYTKIANRIMSKSWITWPFQWMAYLVFSDTYAPGDKISDLKSPLLVIHSKDDPIIPYVFGEEIFNKAPEPKELWSLNGFRHISVFNGQAGIINRQRFLEKLEKRGL